MDPESSIFEPRRSTRPTVVGARATLKRVFTPKRRVTKKPKVAEEEVTEKVAEVDENPKVAEEVTEKVAKEFTEKVEDDVTEKVAEVVKEITPAVNTESVFIPEDSQPILDECACSGFSEPVKVLPPVDCDLTENSGLSLPSVEFIPTTTTTTPKPIVYMVIDSVDDDDNPITISCEIPRDPFGNLTKFHGVDDLGVVFHDAVENEYVVPLPKKEDSSSEGDSSDSE